MSETINWNTCSEGDNSANRKPSGPKNRSRYLPCDDYAQSQAAKLIAIMSYEKQPA